jgi:STE24 endopeptidase
VVVAIMRARRRRVCSVVSVSEPNRAEPWLGALAAAVALAEGAVHVLSPRDGTIAARPVAVDGYFSAEEVERGRRYVRGQRRLGAAAGATETALLVWLVRRGGRGGAGLGRSPAGAAAEGAALSLALVVAPLPFAALMRVRALRAGLATQSWRGWAGDVVRSSALGAGFAAAGAATAGALMRRYGERWWLPASIGAVAVAAAVTLLGPLLLEPIFNDFEPLEEGELRRDVLALADTAGVRVGEVYAVDASRRTRAANAYVSGLLASRRIVLYDTLLEAFPPEQARSVVAHELAHVRYRDVARQLLFLAAVAPAAMRAVARVAARLGRGAGGRVPGLPELALAGAVVSAPLGVVARRLSRAIERRADAFSLALTDDADAFVAFEQRLTRQNLAEVDPPRWFVALLATHPPIVERIGIAEAYRAGARPVSPRRRPRWDPRTRAGS